MSSRHPSVKLYQESSCPSESSVVKAWEEHEKKQAESETKEPLSVVDARALACFALQAQHSGFFFEQLVPKVLSEQPNNVSFWSWALWSVRVSEGEGIQVFKDFLVKLDEKVEWKKRWLEPNDAGLCVWDYVLDDAKHWGVNEGGQMLRGQARLVALAERIEALPAEFLDADHPLYPGVARKDVWLWSWCAIPMSSLRLAHLGHLLARGANPNLCVAVEGGKMSVGTAVLWARCPDRERPRWSQNQSVWEEWDTEESQVLTGEPAWLQKVREKPARDTNPVDSKILWAAMELLKAAGMNPQTLQEPGRWGSPLLGLLAEAGTETGRWERHVVGSEWETLTSFGLPWAHPEHPERAVVSILLKDQISLSNAISVYWMPYWKIDFSVWQQALQDTSAQSLLQSHRGVCILLNEPRLMATLVHRFLALAAQQGISPGPQERWDENSRREQPLTGLGTLLEEHLLASSWDEISKLVIEVVGFVSKAHALGYQHAEGLPSVNAAVSLGLELERWQLAGHCLWNTESLEKLLPWAMAPVLGLPVEPVKRQAKKTVEEDEFSGHSKLEAEALRSEKAAGNEREGQAPDERPIALLYSEKSSRYFLEWAETRKEDDVVKAWIGKIHPSTKDRIGRVTSESMPATARRLAKAAPALAGMEKLRQAFPHFEDVVSLINQHLLLESRGRGVFSLPPLLMAGPPGTGKTFFFQELAALVDTSYTMVSMESVTGGFSLVGLDYGYASSGPGLVFETLLKPGSTANPIVLLDEVDKTTDSNYPVAPVLLPLLEPHSARRFRDRCLPLDIDASQICWVATANDLEKVSLPLKSRFNVLNVPAPDFNARAAMALHIYRALRNQNSWGASFDEELPQETLQVLVRPAGSARDLRKNINQGFAAAARAMRSRIEPQDLPVSPSVGILMPWDLPLEEAPPSKQEVAA